MPSAVKTVKELADKYRAQSAQPRGSVPVDARELDDYAIPLRWYDYDAGMAEVLDGLCVGTGLPLQRGTTGYDEHTLKWKFNCKAAQARAMAILDAESTSRRSEWPTGDVAYGDSRLRQFCTLPIDRAPYVGECASSSAVADERNRAAEVAIYTARSISAVHGHEVPEPVKRHVMGLLKKSRIFFLDDGVAEWVPAAPIARRPAAAVGMALKRELRPMLGARKSWVLTQHTAHRHGYRSGSAVYESTGEDVRVIYRIGV